MNELKKMARYLETFIVIFFTIFWFVATDYEKLNNVKDAFIFCFITSILIMWSCYFIFRFCNATIKEVKE